MQTIRDIPSSGANIWGGIGAGISSGLQALADEKLKDIAERKSESKKEKALTPMFGSKVAKALSGLSDQQFGHALRYLTGQGAQQTAQQRTEASSLAAQQKVSANTPDTYALTGRPRPSVAENPYAGQPSVGQALNNFAGAQPRAISQPSMQAAAQKQATMQQLAGLGPQQEQQGLGTIPEAIRQTVSELPKEERKRIGLAAPAKKGGKLTIQDVQQLKQPVEQPANEQQVQQQIPPSAATIKAAFTPKVVEYIDDLNKKAKVGRLNNAILDRMGALSKDVMSRGKAAFLDVVGNFVGKKDLRKSFGNKATQEFEKLGKQFVRGVKEIFGSRPTQWDVQTFLDTIPNLSQTHEGRMEIIRDCKLLNELAELEQKTADDILRGNNGIPPIDFKTRVMNEMAPKEEEIFNKLIMGSGGYKGSTGKDASGTEFVVGKIYTGSGGSRKKWDGSKMVPVGEGE